MNPLDNPYNLAAEHVSKLDIEKQDIEDCIQEFCIAVLEAKPSCRSTEIESQTAFALTVGSRAVSKFLRKLNRYRKTHSLQNPSDIEQVY